MPRRSTSPQAEEEPVSDRTCLRRLAGGPIDAIEETGRETDTAARDPGRRLRPAV